MIIGAIAVVGAAPGELSIVAIPAGYVSEAPRPISKHSVKSLCGLLRCALTTNKHP